MTTWSRNWLIRITALHPPLIRKRPTECQESLSQNAAHFSPREASLLEIMGNGSLPRFHKLHKLDSIWEYADASQMLKESTSFF